MVAPVINRYGTKHSGVSGMRTQIFCQHSGETPLRGGYAQSLTEASNGNPAWEASWPSFVDPIARVRQIQWPNTAWTQGYANPFSVGLECAGYAHFTKEQWLTPEGLKQLENLAHEWVYYWKLEAKYGNEISLRWLTTAEVQKIMAGDRKLDGFATHAQIDPGSRTDPGPNFPYDRLMTRIKQLLGKAPAKKTPTKENDDMPLGTWFVGTNMKVPGDGKWRTLKDSKGNYSILNGNQAHRTLNDLKVNAKGLPKGAELALRFVIVKVEKGKKTVIHKVFDRIEVVGTSGTSQGQNVTMVNLPKGSGYRLRAQVACYSEGVDLSKFKVETYYWKRG